MFSQLPHELQYQIVFQLSLKDMKEFSLSHKDTIKINWKDYFVYHTGIDEKIMNNFVTIDSNSLMKFSNKIIDDHGFSKWDDYFYEQATKSTIIDEEFMKKHGKYLLNKPVNFIKQYIMIWPKLLALDLTNRKEASLNFINKDRKHYNISFNERICVRLIANYVILSKKRYHLSSIYDKLRKILLANDIIRAFMIYYNYDNYDNIRLFN